MAADAWLWLCYWISLVVVLASKLGVSPRCSIGRRGGCVLRPIVGNGQAAGRRSYVALSQRKYGKRAATHSVRKGVRDTESGSEVVVLRQY